MSAAEQLQAAGAGGRVRRVRPPAASWLALAARPVLLVLAASGCAGTAPGPSPAPFSSLLAARLAWDARGGPFYRVQFSLPARELAPADSADPIVRLVISARAASARGKVLGTRLWTERLDRAALTAKTEHRGGFDLATTPGTQDLRLTILVQGQPYGPPWRRRFHVPEPGPEALFLGEPVFLGCDAAVGRDSCAATPLVAGYFDRDTGPPRFRCTVYDFAPPPPGRSYGVTYAIRGLESDAEPFAMQGDVAVPWAAPAPDFEVALPMLPLGRYGLEVRVQADGRTAGTAAVFEVGLADLAALGGDGGIEMLRLLLPAGAAQAVAEAPAAAREAVWEQAWRALDPDPATPANEQRDEMLRRLRYANAHFSATTSGWRSARGRVYVQRGMPDRIDVLQNPEGFDRLERWTYAARDEVFVFVDRDGSGDYTLLRTNATERF